MSAAPAVSIMPPPCNVIFRGRGYRFEGEVPPYTPFLRRKTTGKAIIALSVVGIALAVHFRSDIGGMVRLILFLTVLLATACFGWVWYKKAAAAIDVFVSAPRNCSLTSTDSDVFYARK